jgi:hypothetical protein
MCMGFFFVYLTKRNLLRILLARPDLCQTSRRRLTTITTLD